MRADGAGRCNWRSTWHSDVMHVADSATISPWLRPPLQLSTKILLSQFTLRNPRQSSPPPGGSLWSLLPSPRSYIAFSNTSLRRSQQHARHCCVYGRCYEVSLLSNVCPCSLRARLSYNLVLVRWRALEYFRANMKAHNTSIFLHNFSRGFLIIPSQLTLAIGTPHERCQACVLHVLELTSQAEIHLAA